MYDKKIWFFSFVLVGLAVGIYYAFIVRLENQWLGLYPVEISWWSVLWLCIGFIVPLGIFWIFFEFIPREQVYTKEVQTLAYNTTFLRAIPFFFLNAFAEELLFRGTLQHYIGIFLTSILFMLVHIAYYKKPFLLLEVFVYGLFLGFLYNCSESLWICTICHMSFNMFVVWLIKTQRIIYKP